jgi:hypothetical protein
LSSEAVAFTFPVIGLDIQNIPVTTLCDSEIPQFWQPAMFVDFVIRKSLSDEVLAFPQGSWQNHF